METTQKSIHKGSEKINNGALFFRKLDGSTCTDMENFPHFILRRKKFEIARIVCFKMVLS